MSDLESFIQCVAYNIKPNKYEHDLEHTDKVDNTNDIVDESRRNPEAKEESYTV